MRLAGFSFKPYHLPLVEPWISAQGQFAFRDGWLIRLATDDGIGYGDCAPLPQPGHETRDRVLAGLTACAELLPGTPLDALQAKLDGWAAVPSLRNAVETAWLDLLAQKAGCPLARWLNPQAAAAVKLNAVIGALDHRTQSRAMTAMAAGFAVLKLKVGLAPISEELAGLRALAQILPPGTALRLDANRAWSRAEAQMFLAALHGLPVESLEDPLRKPDPERLQQLQASVDFPLAADESLLMVDPGVLLARRAVRRLVLKPMLLGGLRPALALARRASGAGLECVVTTTVDSAVGVAAAFHLAAAVNNDLAHGLATSAWLAHDVESSPQAAGPILQIGPQVGLGVAPEAFFCSL